MRSQNLLKVIFLDFDGVLNSEEFLLGLNQEPCFEYLSLEWWADGIDRTRVKLINELIARTGAKVVISSSWRMGTTIKWLETVLQHVGFKGEIIDMTPRLQIDRCEEIAAWLLQNSTYSFVILDDDSDAEIPGHFVQTSMKTGVTNENIKAAQAILDAPPESNSEL